MLRYSMISFAVSAIVAGLSVAPASAQSPQRWLCGDGMTSVSAISEASAKAICGQGDKARAFLAACGLEGRHPISIHVTRSIPSEGAERKGGDFDPQTSSIRLVPLVTYMRTSKQRFGTNVATARILHASIAAHEVAHGVFHEHAAALDLPETAHEYVAYVTQLSTLPIDVQRSILEQSEGPPINNLFTFSFFLLRADPERFAIAAWRHFNQPENRCGFLHRVLAGKVHFPPPSD